jgi:DNA polymerase III subunit gamma/tau
MHRVSARRYRPTQFSEVVGQDAIVTALTHALDHQRLHHAYLFTGTRGVGKTTLARIIAKSLNCTQGISANPCGTCSACTRIDQGNFLDLIEVDAASRTKVEDTRELLNHAHYAPSEGRYKVYLIDEVHMLSTHSFNALLKTLEEPPPHLQFLLATTEPEKIPPTVLSRCLQFHLNPILPSAIQGQLEHILEAQKTPYESEATACLAEAAQGSLRDGLSLLDRALCHPSGAINLCHVEPMLGLSAHHAVQTLLHHLNNADADALLTHARTLLAQGAQAQSLLNQILTALQHIACCQLAPSTHDRYPTWVAFAKQCDPSRIQLLHQIALHGKRDLTHYPNPALALEMTLLRMLAFQPASAPPENQSTPSASISYKTEAASTKPPPTVHQPVEAPASTGINRSDTPAPASEKNTQRAGNATEVNVTMDRNLDKSTPEKAVSSIEKDLNVQAILGRFQANLEDATIKATRQKRNEDTP